MGPACLREKEGLGSGSRGRRYGVSYGRELVGKERRLSRNFAVGKCKGVDADVTKVLYLASMTDR
jgi:hypothetical protein